jgi:hypothetical protein
MLHPRIVKSVVCMCMCIYPHNFDSSGVTNMPLTSTFAAGKKPVKKLWTKVSAKDLLDTYSIVRGEIIGASLHTSSDPWGRTLNEALTFGFV